jgi:hypothetical protein
MQKQDKIKDIKKISPEEYRNILKDIEIKSISLKKCKSSLDASFEMKLGMKASIKTKAQYKNVNDSIIIEHSYILSAKQPGGKIKLLEIEATYKLELNSKQLFTDQFFEIYKEGSLMLNTWPFFREFVNNMTSRMNIPPMTLPFFKR